MINAQAILRMGKSHNSNIEIIQFEGSKDLEKYHREILDTDELYSYFNLSDVKNVLPSQARIFKEALESNADMHMYEITTDREDKEPMTEFFEKCERYHHKTIKRNIKLSLSSFIVTPTHIMALSTKPVEGFIIKSRATSAVLKEMFMALWYLLRDDGDVDTF
jgi:hypothetical protein